MAIAIGSRLWRLALSGACLSAMPATIAAQPADLPIPAATTTNYPDGIRPARVDGEMVYIDAAGRVLYGLDMRTVTRWTADPPEYCRDRCEDWVPVSPSADTKVNIAFPKGFGARGREQHAALAEEQGYYADPQEAPDWTVIESPAGRQWVYKGWHLVFVRKGEGAASTRFDGADEKLWNTLKFVPPAPEVSAPAAIAPVFVDGDYALTDGGGNLLYTGRCRKDCDGWTPLAGGLASKGVGDWSIDRSGDVPQWAWRGKPVYVAQGDDASLLPPRARLLKPGN
ncbi:MAG: hypothetical protein R3D89_12200 [Sphingomonadaceae bacterium]